jgi:hypothetical protein
MEQKRNETRRQIMITTYDIETINNILQEISADLFNSSTHDQYVVDQINDCISELRKLTTEQEVRCNHEFTIFKRIVVDECDPEFLDLICKCKHCSDELHTQYHYVDKWIKKIDTNED